MNVNRLALALSKTLAIYGMAGFLYAVFEIHFWPVTMGLELAAFFPLRTDFSGQLFFAVSFFGFMGWQYLSH